MPRRQGLFNMYVQLYTGTILVSLRLFPPCLTLITFTRPKPHGTWNRNLIFYQKTEEVELPATIFKKNLLDIFNFRIIHFLSSVLHNGWTLVCSSSAPVIKDTEQKQKNMFESVRRM